MPSPILTISSLPWCPPFLTHFYIPHSSSLHMPASHVSIRNPSVHPSIYLAPIYPSIRHSSIYSSSHPSNYLSLYPPSVQLKAFLLPSLSLMLGQGSVLVSRCYIGVKNIDRLLGNCHIIREGFPEVSSKGELDNLYFPSGFRLGLLALGSKLLECSRLCHTTRRLQRTSGHPRIGTEHSITQASP